MDHPARTLQRSIAWVLAALVAVGCAAIHERLTGRHLECLEADAVCIRITDLAYEEWGATADDSASDPTFTMLPEDCRRRQILTATRCWMVFLDGEDGSQANLTVIERADGTIVPWRS